MDYDIFVRQYPYTTKFLKLLEEEGHQQAKAFLEEEFDTSTHKGQVSLNAYLNALEDDQGYIKCVVHAHATNRHVMGRFSITSKGHAAYLGYLSEQEVRDKGGISIVTNIKGDNNNNAVAVGDSNRIGVSINETQAQALLSLLKENREVIPDVVKEIEAAENQGENNQTIWDRVNNFAVPANLLLQALALL